MAQTELFDKDGLVVKSNQLVQARINWTKLEHRVVSMLISQLKKNDEVFSLQRVYIKDLLDLSGTKSRDVYDRAEEICQKLLDQKVHVRTQTEDGRRVYQGYNCMSTCRYVEGSGYIEAKFNDDMKPFLLQLRKRFTMYKLQNFMRLSSQHSMRMYELIKMREGLTYLRISIDELREILCCEHSYDRFSDFKRYVLEKARTELKEVCDVYFTYKVEREGRTPVRVNFMIHHHDEHRKANGSGLEPAKNAQSRLDRVDDESTPEAAHQNGASAPQFNIFAMVLGDLTQEELDRLSESKVQSAIDSAKQSTERDNGDAASSVIASETVRKALQSLRADL
jgi:plasmid replication initiation protein